MSPALAGRFSTTAPPGKPWGTFFHVLKRAKNRKSDASLGEAVWGMGSRDSASERGVA